MSKSTMFYPNSGICDKFSKHNTYLDLYNLEKMISKLELLFLNFPPEHSELSSPIMTSRLMQFSHSHNPIKTNTSNCC